MVLLLVVPELVGELFVEPSSKAGEGARRADEVMKDSKIQGFKDSKIQGFKEKKKVNPVNPV
ncbi:MAG: hypothetical protein CVT94_00915 [Bacteroidetes bacterium HGW-Bacteroidetes-11]|nr:MAG: hypothetical protein CVT94_00915 [Bacteroidetes bacterium HGW-Bacteroidetes-11]